MHRNIRKFRSHFISLVLSFSLALACGGVLASVPANGAARIVRLRREFKLKPGQQVSLKGTKLRIKFMAVDNDSRCALDVTCVWAGNAEVRIWVSSGRGGKTLTLNTNKSQTLNDEAQYQGFKIRLVTLSPHPRTDRKIASGDYTATLVVSEN